MTGNSPSFVMLPAIWLTDAVNGPHAHDSEIVADIVTERPSGWVSEKNNATPQQIKKAREIAKKAKNAESARKAVESGGAFKRRHPLFVG